MTRLPEPGGSAIADELAFPDPAVASERGMLGRVLRLETRIDLALHLGAKVVLTHLLLRIHALRG